MHLQSPLDSTQSPCFRYTFTVFTPTYNRAHSLRRVYDSLRRQTYRNFEWLIIDDGSTDRTAILVEQWQQEASFPIRYYHQANSGKHIAYNRAAQIALGEFLVNLDSDDGCTPDALERFKFHWDQIPANQQAHYSGIDCLCQDVGGQIIGSPYPQTPLDSHYSEIRYRFRVTGEKWGCQRTEIIRQFPFPNCQGSRLEMPESVVWSRLTRSYPARYVNEALRIYYTDGADQITRVSWADKDTTGYWFCYYSMFEFDLDYFWSAPLLFSKAAANYSRASWHRGYGLKTQIACLQSGWAKILWLCLLLLGSLLWLRDRYNRGHRKRIKISSPPKHASPETTSTIR